MKKIEQILDNFFSLKGELHSPLFFGFTFIYIDNDFAHNFILRFDYK